MREVADEIAKAHLRLVKVKEDFIAAACPFHKGGQERRPSFWINRSTGEWGCWSCSERGPNLLTLLKGLGISSRKVAATVEAAEEEAKKEQAINRVRRRRKARAEFRGEHILPDTLLAVFDFCPTRLLDEGFEEETLRRHDIGFDKRRSRITFPIRDLHGNLIGISGRTVEPGGYPKYKVYEGWTNKDGIRSPNELGEWFPDYSPESIRDHLWRMHFVYKDIWEGRSSQLIVVEGYKAAMWLAQLGWENTVAIMGSRMSAAQERIIRRLGTETWIFLDNNRAGIEGTEDIQDRLGSSTFPVYLCSYPSNVREDMEDEDLQPSDLDGQVIESILGSAVRARGRYNGSRRRKLSSASSPC